MAITVAFAFEGYGVADFQQMLAGAPPMQQEVWSLHRVEIHPALRELASSR